MSITDFFVIVASLFAIAGSIAATIQYFRRGNVDWRIVFGAASVVMVIVIIGLFVSRAAAGAVDNQASSSGRVSATNTPSATSTPVPTPLPTTTPMPTATATPIPAPGTILYRADWSQGPDGWGGSGDWKFANGMLINDGTYDSGYYCGNHVGPSITAPYQPETTDYAIEVQVQVVRGSGCFEIPARAQPANDNWSGYQAGMWTNGGTCDVNACEAWIVSDRGVLQSVAFNAGTGWRTYRFEVKGTSLKLFVDGGLVLSVSDATYLTNSGQLGLWDNNVYLNVRSFTVTAL